jgi:hypothetical protein
MIVRSQEAVPATLSVKNLFRWKLFLKIHVEIDRRCINKLNEEVLVGHT